MAGDAPRWVSSSSSTSTTSGVMMRSRMSCATRSPFFTARGGGRTGRAVRRGGQSGGISRARAGRRREEGGRGGASGRTLEINVGEVEENDPDLPAIVVVDHLSGTRARREVGNWAGKSGRHRELA